MSSSDSYSVYSGTGGEKGGYWGPQGQVDEYGRPLHAGAVEYPPPTTMGERAPRMTAPVGTLPEPVSPISSKGRVERRGTDDSVDGCGG